MNTTIGVYDTHEKAIESIDELKRAGFPVQQWKFRRGQQSKRNPCESKRILKLISLSQI